MADETSTSARADTAAPADTPASAVPVPGVGLPPPRLLRWEIVTVFAVSLGASGVYALVQYIGSVKPALRSEFPHYTASQINQAFKGFLILALVSAGIGIALWIFMARANGKGRNWARIVSSVLFAIETLSVLEALRGPKTVVGLVFPALTWLVGLGAIWLLWRPESSAFFKTEYR